MSIEAAAAMCRARQCFPDMTSVAAPWYTWDMAEPSERELDEIERELRKLKGFGSTLVFALGAAALTGVLIALVLWMAVF
jgi:hypothetical protein